ncbi:uncharacterized protein LOC129966400 [Argiope bruennichi]|uniref:Uncharacterized protein n=1 Tax=Argiope bruennichi TaxID=94029 RepID=A0A8T0E301_ARGBR|nr:uncharacterized protein LOC129966400 [Argiope bruennichi]XP_055936873.1 uncharacterized protein LOC129966400 [Argiope bruennichi]KAF8765188.1 hypothetical protein HNY73_023176 [Argiope bruennichi]
MILLWSNCVSSQVEEEGLLVVLSVATATLAFFLNLLQLIVIVHQRLLYYHKNLVVLHFCLCGQLSCAPVLCGLIVAPPLSSSALAPVLHLLSLFTFAPLITLLVLQQHPLGRPPRALTFLLLLAWCQALLISLVPLTGWYGTRPASFAALLCALYFLHYPLVLILLVDLCLKRRSNRIGVVPDVESRGHIVQSSAVKQDGYVSSEGHLPVYVHLSSLSPHKNEKFTEGTSSDLKSLTSNDFPNKKICSDPRDQPFRMRNDILLVCLWSACTLPFFCQTALMAGNSQQDFCDALFSNERTALWTSWLTMLFAAIRPVFHTQLEDDLGESTVTFINVLCQVNDHLPNLNPPESPF